MFQRKIIQELEKWADKSNRKPLVLRGARQTGKTTVVNQFAKQFDEYVYLNLELQEDQQAFSNFKNIETLIQAIFFIKDKVFSKEKKTLIFIDEIQEVPEALNILRYFYEQDSGLYVIAAGSLLETLFNQNISFPVGRVEYLVIRPASFPEFLDALNENNAIAELNHVPLNDFAYQKLFTLYQTYALIGGMPEIVKQYAENKDLVSLQPLYESLITSYIDDVEKYASNASQVQILRQSIRASYIEAGKRIKFQGFGKSNYGSREMGEALRTLEKALLIYIIFPSTDVDLPIMPDMKKSPRLHVLDTGMMNYFVGIQKEILNTDDLNSIHQGLMIEHLTGQELLATKFNALSTLNFWVREKNSSTAEVDYIYQYENKLIPIEVKSGATGKLKSLHVFMDMASHNMAVRIYAGKLEISKIKTSLGKEYFLLNLPHFLISQIDKYLEWFEDEIKI